MTLGPELEAWLRLALIPQLGPVAFRKLLADFGDPESAADASVALLARSVGDAVAAAIRAGPKPAQFQAALDWLAQPPNQVLTLADSAYSRALLEIADPPPLLYVKGDPALLERPAIAIVGSRNATAQGAANAQAFGRELSDNGFVIVSGLALGIDAAAHRGGLAGASSSIAVLGNGLDIVYPARNRDLAHELAKSGLLVSELPVGSKPLGSNFPRRNRLISGLARGVLVVEAASESGSLITARCALEQGREVFAIPGSIHSPLSKGCHRLIKQGAKLVEQAADILEELGYRARAMPISNAEPLPERFAQIVAAMSFDPSDFDTLCARAGLTAENASAMLLELELDGVVARLPGGKFQRVR
ncbi:MAG: DNA-processing protein DprA [Burkholderiales bacterium]